NVWGTFDGNWYATVARLGYPEDNPPLSTAFFPLYPMLMRLAAEAFGGPVSDQTVQAWGVFISLLAFLFALYFVYRIAEDGWGWRAARGTVLTLAFFPTAFYFNAVYTESLFLALAAGSVWAARVRKDLLLAAGLAALATLTRHVGVLLLIPLLYEWLGGIREYRFRGAYLALVPSGLVAYMAFLWQRFGDPLIFQEMQGSKEWRRTFTPNPLEVLDRSWAAAKRGLHYALDPAAMFDQPRSGVHAVVASNVYNLLALFFVVAMLALGLRYLTWDLYLYAFLFTVPFVFYGSEGRPLYNLPRLVLVAFPLFIVLGVVLQNRWALIAWLIPSAAFSLLLCAMFVTWRWVA
ncbi:MAG: hypothetical protein M3R38_29500, partial [Actinomycetota bacterium]|nr:hypothetical protein [Actinomycetota bacterium]